MSEGYDGLPAYYSQSSDPITPNLGLSLKGMDPIIAENFVILDSNTGGSSVEVNGVAVSNPNFNDTTPAAPLGYTNVLWQKDGSGNVSAYAQGGSTPGGPTNSIQYNAGSTLGGLASFVLDPTNGEVSITDTAASSTGLAALSVFGNDQSDNLQNWYRFGSTAGTPDVYMSSSGAMTWTSDADLSVEGQLFITADTFIGINVNGQDSFQSDGHNVTIQNDADTDVTMNGDDGSLHLDSSGITYMGADGGVLVGSSTPGGAKGGATINAAGLYINGVAVSTSTLWSQLGNAAADLTLANAGFNTTFNQTSEANWLWANTTAATTAGVNANSPILSIAGTYLNGSGVSTADIWTIQNVMTASHRSVTVTNISENSSSVVTLTITGGNFVSGEPVTFAGLTTGTWLNGQTASLTSANSTTLVFTDPTSHGTQASHAETGTVTQTNPKMTLTIGHSGSAGVPNITLPAGSYLDFSGTGPTPDGNQTGISRQQGLTNGALTFNSTGGSVAMLTLKQAGTAYHSFQTSGYQTINQTTATVSTTNASPTVSFLAKYWDGAASAQDTWTIGSSLAAGTNGASSLTFAHSGSTGLAHVVIPIVRFGTGFPYLYGSSAGVLNLQANLSGSTNTQLTFNTSNGGATLQPFTITAVNAGGALLVAGSNLGATLQQVTIAGCISNVASGAAIQLGCAVAANASAKNVTGDTQGVRIGLGSSIGSAQGELNFVPVYGTGTFSGFYTNFAVNQAAVSNTVVGSALVANVGVLVFSTANVFVAGATTLMVNVATNTALNGTQTIVALGNRAGSPYTITNAVENSSSVVTLTIGTHAVSVNDWIFVTGLTGTFTHLNGQTVKVSAVSANVSVSFTDLTTHGTQASAANTGTVTDNFVTWSQTHANITGSADSGTAVQQATGSYTGIKLNVVETSLGGTANKLIDLQAGASGGTSMFSIDNVGSLFLKAQTAPTSAGTAGTAGQVMTDGSLLYFCSVTGAAGAATWNKLNMTAV